MLLDANNPSIDFKPAPNAAPPARAESKADRDPPATNDRSTDPTPPPANENGSTRDVHRGKATDDKGKDGNAADDAKNAGDNNTTETGDTEQASADSAGTDTEISSATIVAGPAIALVAPAADTAPAPSAKSSDKACAAPIVAPPVAPALFNADVDDAAPSGHSTTAQVTTDDQSSDAGNPMQQVTAVAPAIADASAETDSDAASAMPAVVTAGSPGPAKKPAATEVVASTPPAESSDPTNEGALTATAATNTKPTLRAAAIETGKSGVDKSEAGKSETGKSDTDKLEVGKSEAGKSDEVKVQPQTKPHGNGDSVHVDSASANANSAAAASNGQPAKSEGAKSEEETVNAHARHAVTEQIFNVAPKSESPSQIADSASIKVPADNAPVLNSTLQVPQTIAPAQTFITPAVAAVAAIPLAALPIEIAARAKDGVNRFEIRLDPPELGRIDVRLDIDRTGHVTSRLMVERPETLDLLRRDAPQIERALQDAGLKTSDLGMQFSLRDQTFADQNDPLPSVTSLVLPQDDTVPLEAMRQGYGRLFGLGGGIDIRV